MMIIIVIQKVSKSNDNSNNDSSNDKNLHNSNTKGNSSSSFPVKNLKLHQPWGMQIDPSSWHL